MASNERCKRILMRLESFVGSDSSDDPAGSRETVERPRGDLEALEFVGFISGQRVSSCEGSDSPIVLQDLTVRQSPGADPIDPEPKRIGFRSCIHSGRDHLFSAGVQSKSQRRVGRASSRTTASFLVWIEVASVLRVPR